VHDDDLSGESLGFLGGVVLGVGTDRTTTDVLDGDVLNVETNIVSRDGLRKRFVMHFNGLDFSGHVLRSKGDNHSWLDNSSFNTTDWDSSDTSDLVHILEGKTERTSSRTSRRNDGIQSLKKSLSGSISFLALNAPSLVPGHVGADFEHVVT
ncbi:hypothetical protein P5E91_15490, partial [Clostridium perfringens]|nr:hypothetical protein [Clostridium perfringens]